MSLSKMGKETPCNTKPKENPGGNTGLDDGEALVLYISANNEDKTLMNIREHMNVRQLVLTRKKNLRVLRNQGLQKSPQGPQKLCQVPTQDPLKLQVSPQEPRDPYQEPYQEIHHQQEPPQGTEILYQESYQGLCKNSLQECFQKPHQEYDQEAYQETYQGVYQDSFQELHQEPSQVSYQNSNRESYQEPYQESHQELCQEPPAKVQKTEENESRGNIATACTLPCQAGQSQLHYHCPCCSAPFRIQLIFDKSCLSHNIATKNNSNISHLEPIPHVSRSKNNSTISHEKPCPPHNIVSESNGQVFYPRNRNVENSSNISYDKPWPSPKSHNFYDKPCHLNVNAKNNNNVPDDKACPPNNITTENKNHIFHVNQHPSLEIKTENIDSSYDKTCAPQIIIAENSSIVSYDNPCPPHNILAENSGIVSCDEPCISHSISMENKASVSNDPMQVSLGGVLEKTSSTIVYSDTGPIEHTEYVVSLPEETEAAVNNKYPVKEEPPTDEAISSDNEFSVQLQSIAPKTYFKETSDILQEYDLRKCEGCNFGCKGLFTDFHCPICPTSRFKPTRKGKVITHLKNHFSGSRGYVHMRGYLITVCPWPCKRRNRLEHYHCPLCETQIKNRNDFVTHLTKCNLSPKELDNFKAVQKVIKKVPRSTEYKKEKCIRECPICFKPLAKRYIPDHIKAKHSNRVKERPKHYSVCVELHRGIYTVSHTYRGPQHPVHVMFNKTGSEPHMECSVASCNDLVSSEAFSGHQGFLCDHVSAVEHCTTSGICHDLDTTKLLEMTVAGFMSIRRSQKLVKMHDCACDNSIALMVELPVQPDTSTRYQWYSVFSGTDAPEPWCVFQRVIVTKDNRKKSLFCSCSRKPCLHKSAVRWLLFQLNRSSPEFLDNTKEPDS